MYYGYDPFYISAGRQHLDGATALKFARTRHSDSDFRRAERQQMVIQAARDKILDLNILPQLIAQSPELWRTFENNVYTSMSLDQMIQLAWYLKDIPSENLTTGVISQEYTIGHRTSGGASVLIPNRGTIGPLMVDVFGADYSQ
jgi:anionic cell wall polymer biosynthesis LytR-Cps2A-Psr (LCP) family protein